MGHGAGGLFLMVCASVFVAFAAGQMIQKTINKEREKFGILYWRPIVVLLGVVFIPVPVEMTMTYSFTVLC